MGKSSSGASHSNLPTDYEDDDDMPTSEITVVSSPGSVTEDDNTRN